MDVKLLSELRQKLLEEKALLERELSSFATKDPKMKGDWDARFPKYGDPQSGSHASLDEMANEVEEYESLVEQEHALETRLEEVTMALGRMEKGEYGICKVCNKPISEDRLRANPAAEFDIEHDRLESIS